LINKNIIIALCIRDCAEYLDDVISNIENIRSLFNKTKVVFVESDSSDKTLDLLEKYKVTHDDVDIITHGNLASSMPYRTDRIAYCRNSYLDIAEKNKDDYEYLFVLDGDSASTELISNEAILSNFENENWDMITANQPNGYYDIWALRHESWMPFDCWKMYMKEGTKEAFKYYILDRFIKIIPFNSNDGKDYIPVQSAFGGAGIIKINSIKNARHIGHTEDGIQICEWVPFCESLNSGESKIYINPRFVNSIEVSDHIKANVEMYG